MERSTKYRYAVKYCGGCNSRYDRSAACRALETRLGPLPPAQPGCCYDTVFVLCGCTSQCADVAALTAIRFVWISEPPSRQEIEGYL